MDEEIVRIRIMTVQEDITMVLAAQAANAFYIENYLAKIQERLDQLEKDIFGVDTEPSI